MHQLMHLSQVETTNNYKTFKFPIKESKYHKYSKKKEWGSWLQHEWPPQKSNKRHNTKSNIGVHKSSCIST